MGAKEEGRIGVKRGGQQFRGRRIEFRVKSCSAIGNELQIMTKKRSRRKHGKTAGGSRIVTSVVLNAKVPSGRREDVNQRRKDDARINRSRGGGKSCFGWHSKEHSVRGGPNAVRKECKQKLRGMRNTFKISLVTL